MFKSLKCVYFFNLQIDDCILWVSIIFITILCTPQPTIVRWSSAPPVSGEILLQWKGFCALIANAYYVRGMAWLEMLLALLVFYFSNVCFCLYLMVQPYIRVSIENVFDYQ